MPPAFCIVCVLSNMYKRELKRQAQRSAFITSSLSHPLTPLTTPRNSDGSRLVSAMPRCCSVTPPPPPPLPCPTSLLPYCTSPFPQLHTHTELSGLWSYVLLQHTHTHKQTHTHIMPSTSQKPLSQQKTQSAVLCELLLVRRLVFFHTFIFTVSPPCTC